MRTVEDSGSAENATILIVGEAPGTQEVRQGRPFVGPSGQVLRSWMGAAGIDPSEVYMTNVLNFQPPTKGGNLEDAIAKGSITHDTIDAGMANVRQVAGLLPRLRVIVPVGNYACSTFSEHWGKTVFNKTAAGITQCRGSIANVKVSGRNGTNNVLLVPSIHPAAVMRQRQWEQRCLLDWQRIWRLRFTHGEFLAPARDHNIRPTLADLAHAARRADNGEAVCIDIETWGNELKCIGFAFDHRSSLVVPTTNNYTGARFEPGNPWYDAIKYICESDCDKILQNGLFDCWWLAQYGIKVKNFVWDTLAMHHALDPRESHSLDFLASILTEQPYWKDEAKDAEEIARIAKFVGMDRLYVYNGLDVTVTYEIFCRLYDMLEERNMLKFYLKHYANMMEPLLRMTLNGVIVDLEEMKKVQAELLGDAIRLRDEAYDLTGEPMFVFDKTKCEKDMIHAYYALEPSFRTYDNIRNYLISITKTLKSGITKRVHSDSTIAKKWQELNEKGISDAKLNHVLYDVWEAPKGKRTEKTEKVQADDVSLKRVKVESAGRQRGTVALHKANIGRLVDITLEHRHNKKLASFINPAKVDSDGRMRFSYKFTTKSGRLASAENPRKTGMNGQNIPRQARRVYLPRPGNVFVEIDLSQAEGRVVKVLTGDPTMIASARRKPWEGDEHIENAMAIFGYDEDGWSTLEKEQAYLYRQSGKRIVHACNYDMGGNRCSDALLKEGFAFTPHECRALIENRHAMYPQIRAWHGDVTRAVLTKRELVTSWGRRIPFYDQIFDHEVYKFAYSAVPQSEVGDLTNDGLRTVDSHIIENNLQAVISLQVHDSLLIDSPIEELYEVMCVANEALSQTRHYGECLGRDVELSIPVEFKIGNCWGAGHEFKYLPEESMVVETAKEMVA